MVLRTLDRERCLQVLATAPIARLACASGGQPYVVPVFLAYHKSFTGDDCLYGFTTLGQKVEWMRENPLVCVEVDRIASRTEWVSVVAYGRYEELPNVHERKRGRSPSRRANGIGQKTNRFSAEYVNEQLFAHRLLEDRAMWWEPASTVRSLVTKDDPESRFEPVFYKILLSKVTGYEAVHEAAEVPAVELGCSEQAQCGWLSKALHGWLGKGKQRPAVR